MEHIFKKTFLFLILAPIMAFIFALQSCQEPTSPPVVENMENSSNTLLKFSEATIRSNIQKIAKGLSILMQDERNRVILQNEINNSKKVEQILEATEFLKSGRNIYIKGISKNTTFGSSILEMFAGNENAELKDFIDNLPFGLIDIYFPTKQYREQWKSQDDLLIAYFCRDKNDKSDIPSYDLNGNQVYLDYYKAPNTPTLVIYPSEKNENYYPGNESRSFDNSLKKSSSLSSVNSEGPPPPPPTTYHFRVDQFNILHNFESWIGGYMEIYFKVWYKHPGGNWSNPYIPFNVIEGVTAGMGWWHGVPSGDDLYSTTNSGDVIKFEVWEFDGGLNGGDDFVADVNWETVAYIVGGVWRTNVVEFPWTTTGLRAIDLSQSEEDYIDLKDYKLN